MMDVIQNPASNHKPLAQAGLSAKGLVYFLMGIFVFMGAFSLGGQSSGETSKTGVLHFIENQPGGKIILGVVALGLVCYTIWRFIQAIADTNDKGSDAKGLARRARYIFSGIAYASFAFLAIKMVFSAGSSSSGSNSNQTMAQELLSKPFGQVLAGIAALIIIGIGVYQIYYGLSEKYKKHVDKAGNTDHKQLLLAAGKIGYVARGVVWLIIGWLFGKAALEANAAEAGGSTEAFQWLADASYGSYLLGAVGLGLCCYGLFSFIRAKFEKF